jgi:hypothetical protein
MHSILTRISLYQINLIGFTFFESQKMYSIDALGHIWRSIFGPISARAQTANLQYPLLQANSNVT